MMEMEPEPQPQIDLERITRALADPKRFEILELMSSTPDLSCCDFVNRIGVRQPTVSHHLKELTLAGLIIPHRDGLYMRYTVNRAAVDAYLEGLRQRLSAP